MERLNFFIPDPQRAWLEQESQRTGVSVSEIIRRAIDEYREHREALQPRPLRPIKDKRK